MNSIINKMLEKYDISTKEKTINALKEVIQEIVLSALAMTDFFDHAAFYGGTALRIFYGLDRFSEDLDFSLIKKEEFNINKYFNTIEETCKMYGLDFKVEEKKKTTETMITSAFLKGNTLEHIITINPNLVDIKNISKNELIKIKIEVDTNPPHGATFEFKYGLLPIPYKVRLYDKESLFSGKLHAVICRGWNNRFKGRDLYDYIFYLSNNIQPNYKHLKNRLIESNKIEENKEFSNKELTDLLLERFNVIDFENAKNDVISFISDKNKLSIWSKEFFIDISKKYYK